MWYICTVEYYSAIKRNAFESVLIRWMKLEPVTQSGSKSEREIQILYMNAYIWNVARQLMTLQHAGQQRDTDEKNRFWTLWKKVRMG